MPSILLHLSIVARRNNNHKHSMHPPQNTAIALAAITARLSFSITSSEREGMN